MATIRVFAPATVANLACGFDILGLAIHHPGDELMMSFNNSRKIMIEAVTGDQGKLPLNPGQNTAGVSVAAMLKKLNSKQGITIRLHKKMPLGSGLGSSAASAAASVVALNGLLQNPFSRSELVPFAMEGERIACGNAHADNVAPALMGGIILVRSTEPPDIISLPVPANLFVTVVHPHQVLMTKKSRAVLKKNIPLKTVVSQTGNTAAFIAALFNKDMSLLSRSAVDFLAEPFRAPLIPAFAQAKKQALKNGALVCSLSGSGPSIFALCDSKEQAEKTGIIIFKEFEKRNVSADIFVSGINRKGVIITG